MEPMLKVTDLAVSYGHVEALRGINVEVHKGQIVSIIGANGAGKTTLLRTISGLVKPRTGTVEFEGAPLPRKPSKIVGGRGTRSRGTQVLFGLEHPRQPAGRRLPF